MARRIAIVGGGAAGFFAAITAAEADRRTSVDLFERSGRLLTKVRISGGGRCNVTHALFDPRELVQRYPRGSKELRGPFHTWNPSHTVAWFRERGIPLKTEEDGRMFPVTDDSETIVECLMRSAQKAGVRIHTHAGIERVRRMDDGRFELVGATGAMGVYDRLILATGGGQTSGGLGIAKALGHTITDLVPSLFTFKIRDPRIQGLQGMSVPNATVTVPGTKLRQSGALLVTHWGFSGPAILKLSAWGARELAAKNYRFTLRVHWTGDGTVESMAARLDAIKPKMARKKVGSGIPFDVPKRLWERWLQASAIPPDKPWAQIGKASTLKLAREIAQSEFQTHGKSTNKDEFVTCGGVGLRDVNFKTMESRQTPGLYFTGEVLDIDGITGGFNFQAAWTTARIAGLSSAAP